MAWTMALMMMPNPQPPHQVVGSISGRRYSRIMNEVWSFIHHLFCRAKCEFALRKPPAFSLQNTNPSRNGSSGCNTHWAVPMRNERAVIAEDPFRDGFV